MKIETPRQRRRRRAIEAPFPDSWRQILDDDMAHWKWLDDIERDRLELLIKGFLVDKRFEWASGLAESEEIKVLVAGSACLLILGLERAYYRDVASIIMYPSSVVVQGKRPHPENGHLETDSIVPILGEASLHGPMVIAWDAAKRSAAHPHTGHNVIYHEFAHKIDMADGSADGVPPMSKSMHTEWVAVCAREYDALKSGTNDDAFLSDYAGVNRAEFFAVATEFFMNRPIDMEVRKPDLYGVLKDFYQQDPAGRERRYLV